MKPTSRRDLLYIILSMFVLTLGTVFIPFFSFFAMCVMPVPVVWMYMRATWRETAALAIGAVILTVYWGGSYGGTVETGFFCLSGMIMGFGLRKRRSFFHCWGSGFIVLCAMAAVLAIRLYVVQGVTVFTYVQQFVILWGERLTAMATAQGMGEADKVALQTQLQSLWHTVPYMVPSLLVEIFSLSAWITLRLAIFQLHRQGQKEVSFLPVRCWDMGRGMVYLYIVSLVLKYWGTTRSWIWVQWTGENLLQIAFFFICVQGISFLFSFLQARKKSVVFQGLVLLLFFCIPFFSYIVFVLGLADLLFSYRRNKAVL